jgi:hypothetical protein
MIRLLPILPLALIAGCETIPESGAGHCDAKRVQNFVGTLGTSDLGKAMLKRSGAKTLRWIAPGTAVTMDYRTDRLNIRTDARNFVTGVDCG